MTNIPEESSQQTSSKNFSEAPKPQQYIVKSKPTKVSSSIPQTATQTQTYQVDIESPLKEEQPPTTDRNDVYKMLEVQNQAVNAF